MALTLVILADGPSTDLSLHLGPTAPTLYARLLGDTAAVAQQLPRARVVVRYNPSLPAVILAELPPTVQAVPERRTGAAAVAGALADGLAVGDMALVIGGELPHLPLWRLRDAATHLRGEADLVLGPSDGGSWYLIGARASASDLLGAIPGRGAGIGGLVAAGSGGHVIHLLPPWFGVHTVADLAALADALRTMPPSVAAQTRALIESGQASRAVGG